MKTIILIGIISIIVTGYLVACKATTTIKTITNDRNAIIAQIK